MSNKPDQENNREREEGRGRLRAADVVLPEAVREAVVVNHAVQDVDIVHVLEQAYRK